MKGGRVEFVPEESIWIDFDLCLRRRASEVHSDPSHPNLITMALQKMMVRSKAKPTLVEILEKWEPSDRARAQIAAWIRTHNVGIYHVTRTPDPSMKEMLGEMGFLFTRFEMILYRPEYRDETARTLRRVWKATRAGLVLMDLFKTEPDCPVQLPTFLLEDQVRFINGFNGWAPLLDLMRRRTI